MSSVDIWLCYCRKVFLNILKSRRVKLPLAQIIRLIFLCLRTQKLFREFWRNKEFALDAGVSERGDVEPVEACGCQCHMITAVRERKYIGNQIVWIQKRGPSPEHHNGRPESCSNRGEYKLERILLRQLTGRKWHDLTTDRLKVWSERQRGG